MRSIEASVLFPTHTHQGGIENNVSTLERIKKLFLENFDFQEERLQPEATIESLGLDSLDRIEFMFDIENEFHIRIPDEEFKVTTIQDIADVVDRFILEQRIRSLSQVMISNN